MNDGRKVVKAAGRLTAIAILAFFTAAPMVWAGEGFGMMKKSVNLTRILPARVHLVGTRINVHVTAQKKTNESVAERMQSQLESQLVGNDTNLTLDSKNPTSLVDVTVLRNDYSESSETRQETRGQGAGDGKILPKFGVAQVKVTYKVVKHVFSVTLRAHDSRANKTLLAETITKNYKQSFEDGNGAPDAASLEDSDMTEVVGEITSRIAPTKEIVAVLLPRGRLDDAIPYGEAGMWNKYLEAIEKLPESSNPVDESYRKYAMGVAYEALGYGADDLDRSLKFFEKAATFYNSAAEANPKEVNFILGSKSSSLLDRAGTTAGHFIPVMAQHKGEKKDSVNLQAPLARVQAALAQYQKLKDLSGAGPKPPGDSDKSAAASADAVTNESIVEMLHAGLSEEIITTTIDSAPHRALDVSPKGLIQLSEAKASTTLLRHIQSLAAKSSSKGKGRQ
jgi:tetratricopeptide (TPR) repeat protein